MKRLTGIQIGIIGILIVIAIALGAVSIKEYSYVQTETEIVENAVTILPESGFYKDTIMLEISGDNITEIYYTLDGSDPARHNPTALPYQEEIVMPKNEAEAVYTIRMLAYYEDGSISDIINRTYVIGENVESRYDVPVLTVTGTDEFFFGEANGIMTSSEGKGSRGRESEGEVFMTFFTPDGRQLLAQNCGFRLFGNFSREKNQRSFRLFGRLAYDEQNEFDYAFFDNQYSENNTRISEFKRLDIRNSGQDNGYALIRGELATRLSLDAGYPDAPGATPVAVYINDKYYGFYWIITNFNDTYYRNTYGDYEGTMYTFEGKITKLSVDEEETDLTYLSLANDYNEKIVHFAECDLAQEKNWQELNAFMDVENFLQYVAIHHYVGNTDSFFNNYRIYRYVAPEGGTYTENSVFDGKFRFLLFDLDWAFAFQGGDFRTSVEDLTTTKRINSSSDYYAFFQNLMKRKDCQEYYIRYMLSMQNRYFSAEYAGAVMEQMHDSRAQELYYMYTTTDLLKDNALSPDITSEADVEREMERIRHFLENRPHYTTEDLSGSFGPFTTYELQLKNENRANVTLDYATLNDMDFKGTYYKEIPVLLTANPKPGYQFDYWLVNGEKYEQESLEITEEMISGAALIVECVSSKDPEAGFIITAVKSRNNADYIQLTNLSTKAQNMSGYYLTDDENWNKCPLPGIVIEPGATVTVYCENYTGVEALGQPYVNFNIKEGEVLSLYQNGQKEIQKITIPLLGLADGIFKMDMATGEFWEQDLNSEE